MRENEDQKTDDKDQNAEIQQHDGRLPDEVLQATFARHSCFLKRLQDLAHVNVSVLPAAQLEERITLLYGAGNGNNRHEKRGIPACENSNWSGLDIWPRDASRHCRSDQSVLGVVSHDNRTVTFILTVRATN